MNYYNDNDPHAAAWLRQLIADGLLPPGDVDERGIADVVADDIRGYRQVHMFGGIGGWPYALQLAGWPDEWPVWTGSCPCQPYSAAGQRRGDDDERNLWPEFRRLIAECRPSVVFGEQVSSAIGYGWLDGVSTDLEAEGYAVGSAVLGAHSIGAPHIRQRLYWVADAVGIGRRGRSDGYPDGKTERVFATAETQGSSRIDGLDIPNSNRWQAGQSAASALGYGSAAEPAGGVDGLGNAQGFAGGSRGEEEGALRRQEQAGTTSPWLRFDLIECADGKTRRVGSGVRVLADGVPARVAKLRGLGNAIVPQVAAEFVNAFMEVKDGFPTTFTK